MSNRKIGRLWAMRIWTIQFSTPFSEKIDLSGWCSEILVLARLDGLLIGENNSFLDKLLVSMRCLSKFSYCFSEYCARMFFRIPKTLNSCSAQNYKISSYFLRSFEIRSINFEVTRGSLVIIFSKRLP